MSLKICRNVKNAFRRSTSAFCKGAVGGVCAERWGAVLKFCCWKWMTLVSSEITGQAFPVAVWGNCGLSIESMLSEALACLKAVGSVLPSLHSLCRGAWGAQRPADTMVPIGDAQLSRCALVSALSSFSSWRGLKLKHILTSDHHLWGAMVSAGLCAGSFFKRLLNVYIPWQAFALLSHAQSYHSFSKYLLLCSFWRAAVREHGILAPRSCHLPDQPKCFSHNNSLEKELINLKITLNLYILKYLDLKTSRSQLWSPIS